MHLKDGKKLYNERGITFFHETETYVNDLNIYNRSKNGTNLWDDLTRSNIFFFFFFGSSLQSILIENYKWQNYKLLWRGTIT